jgi:competence protein ComEC
VSFYLVVGGFLSGTYFFQEVENYNNVFIFLFFIFIYAVFISRHYRLILIVIFFGLGVFRVSLIENVNTADFLVGKNEQFEGVIIFEPDKRENNIHYVFFVEEYNFITRITMPKFPELDFNEVIVFKGVLEKPDKFENENGIEFNYPKFLSKDGIGYVMFRPQIISREDYKSDSFLQKIKVTFYKFLFFIKDKFTNSLQRELKNPQAGLAAGILIGSKQALGKDLLDDFRRAGLIHLVVLSGYNVTIIADAIRKVFSSLPIFYSKFFSIFFILAFAILTGASATTIRASIMAIIAVLVFSSTRKYEVVRALWVAAFFMVLHNPKILTSDPGFQLSFVATLGLIHISPYISSKIKFITEKFQLREIISTTIATQIAVFPLIIKMTGELSVISIIANIIVLPLMPFAMLISAIAGLISFLGPPAKIFSFPAYLILSFIIWVAEFCSSLSFAVVKVVFDYFPV